VWVSLVGRPAGARPSALGGQVLGDHGIVRRRGLTPPHGEGHSARAVSRPAPSPRPGCLTVRRGAGEC